MDKRILLMTAFVFVLIGAISAYAQEIDKDRGLETRIDNYLSSGVEHGFSGAILVSLKGNTIINKGYGFADKEKKNPNTRNTVFDIGSNTKQFTATAILKLVESKKLKLTDSIYKFFNNVPDDKKNITIHQLLSHSAGLVDVIGGDFDHISETQFFQKLFSTDLLHQPGSKYKYSNAGFSILARIIEIVSNQDYETFLNKQLFIPAGMKHTGYLIPAWDDNMLAMGYSRNVFERGSMVKKYQEDGEVSWHLKGNGGINSTQEDMHNWYKALKTNKVISQTSFDILTSPHIKRYSGAQAYGYGWGISLTDRNTKILAHNGANGAFFHTFIWLPEEDIVIIYACNTSSPQFEAVGHRIKKMVLNENYEPTPIKKGVYFRVFDFIESNTPDKSMQLLSILREDYNLDYKSPGILNRIGYTILESKKNLDWAVEIFKLNTKVFPFDENVWDSLGDGFLALGKKQEAIINFKKAVQLGSDATIDKLNELLSN